jgi:SRSO17 transposase
MGRNDQSALNHWLTDAGWNEEKLEKAGKEAILESLRSKQITHGLLVVDDTLSHKTGKRMEGVNIHYDHAEGRYALGHQIVTSHIVAGRLSLPIDLELYRRDGGQDDFRSKQELARSLIGRAAADGFPFTCILIDTWYFNKANTDYIEGLGRSWVAGCKSNRLIHTPKGWTPLSTYLEAVPRSEFKEAVIQTGDGERRGPMQKRHHEEAGEGEARRLPWKPRFEG